MENIYKFLGVLAVILVTVTFMALITGTVIWILYPSTLPVLFTSMPSTISWWTAVKLSWICALLFKTTINTK